MVGGRLWKPLKRGAEEKKVKNHWFNAFKWLPYTAPVSSRDFALKPNKALVCNELNFAR